MDLFEEIFVEDQIRNDKTTQALESFLKSRNLSLGSMEFEVRAKSANVLAGVQWVKALLSKDRSIELNYLKADGEALKPGDKIMTGSGPVASVLAIERTLLNGLQHLSGVATQTRKMVETIEQVRWENSSLSKPALYHTRKTLPLMRSWQIEAVLAGGGCRHRESLADRILFKDNHKYVLRRYQLSLGAFVEETIKSQNPKSVMIEVETEAEALECIQAGAQSLLLDNFQPEAVRELLAKISSEVEIEVSGGLTLQNLASYVIPGVNRLSVGALTHSVKAADISLEIL